jgi:quercetin dioxygenase-like cupin family protein
MTNMYTFHQDLAEIFPEPPEDSIVSRTIINGDDSRVILFSFAPGQELSEHTASMPAILHFVSGEADVTLGDDGFTAQANTWVHMEPNLPHSIVAKTAVSMLLIMIKQ